MNVSNSQKWAKEADRFSAKQYLCEFLEELGEKESQKVNLNCFQEAERIKSFMNNPISPFETPSKHMQPSWSWQEIDLVPSNLGRGYIIYYICSQCDDRVKYLYYQDSLNQPVCRVCCRLGYKTTNRREKTLSRLYKKDYLSEYDKEKIVAYFGITVEDVERSKKLCKIKYHATGTIT